MNIVKAIASEALCKLQWALLEVSDLILHHDQALHLSRKP